MQIFLRVFTVTPLLQLAEVSARPIGDCTAFAQVHARYQGTDAAIYAFRQNSTGELRLLRADNFAALESDSKIDGHGMYHVHAFVFC